MDSCLKELIETNLTKTYKTFLTHPCVLSSLTVPKHPTKDIITHIGYFPQNTKKAQVISLNVLDEDTILSDYKEIKDVYLEEVNNIISKIIRNSTIYYSLSIDYRLLKDNIIESIKEKYQEQKFTLRIIGEDYILDEKTYKKISFMDEILVNQKEDNFEPNEDSDIIINNSLVIDNIIPNKDYEPINEFYVNKDLGIDEYKLVIDKINNTISGVKKLFIRIYKPERYPFIIRNIIDDNLDEITEINFLANPLLDDIKYFKPLIYCKNRITITYSTNSSRIERLEEEPYSDASHYKEELEINGKISLKDYLEILNTENFLTNKAKSLDLSPFEKLIYVYRYVIKNSTYFKQNEITHEETYINQYGYASLYSIYLRKLEVPVYVYTTSKAFRNIIYLNDKKYKLKQILVNDITKDIETNKYPLYGIYSFANFGMSIIDTLKERRHDFITIPASLVIKDDEYNKYISHSYNPSIREHNLNKDVKYFAYKFLTKSGIYKGPLKDIKKVLSNFLVENVLDGIDPKLLEKSISLIVDREINDKRVEQKSYEIENAVKTNKIGKSQFQEKPAIKVTIDGKKENREVEIIEPISSDENLNKELRSFIKETSDYLEKIYTTNLESLKYLTSKEEPIEKLYSDLVKLYNDERYKLITDKTKENLMESLHNKYEKLLYAKIDKELYTYLTNIIIPELNNIVTSNELNYLLNCPLKKYNSKEYNKYSLKLSNRMKFLINKLSSQKSKRLNITYELKNHILTINVANPLVDPYKLYLLNPDLFIPPKKRVINMEPEEYIDYSHLNDYLDVYKIKLNKYNESVKSFNKVIEDIEKIEFDLKDDTCIDRFINLESSMIKLEDAIFLSKIDLSNFRTIFYTKFKTNINNYDEISNYKVETYSYKKKFKEYTNLLKNIELEILSYQNDPNIEENPKVQKLLKFLDYLESYLNRRIIDTSPSNIDLQGRINSISNFKKEIILKIKRVKDITSGLNITIKDPVINQNQIIVVKTPYRLLTNVTIIRCSKIKNNINLRKNTDLLNKIRNQKRKIGEE